MKYIGKAPGLASEPQSLKWGDEGAGVMYGTLTDFQRQRVDVTKEGVYLEDFNKWSPAFSQLFEF